MCTPEEFMYRVLRTFLPEEAAKAKIIRYIHKSYTYEGLLLIDPKLEAFISELKGEHPGDYYTEPSFWIYTLTDDRLGGMGICYNDTRAPYLS